jgi:hypothetical protein
MKAFVVFAADCYSYELYQRNLFVVLATTLEEAKVKAAHELGIAELTDNSKVGDISDECRMKYPADSEYPEIQGIDIEEVPLLVTV